ncbi:hypothetical protein CPB84DRAFT_1855557 [Gymnopilus junonius]|uniref:Uncharacterized protein n=1 Tax=Gymnopilus junonius TaxID=109634 RepID=A0A9P5N9P1_GYMJU|nr:hypothetical protein CPB84DRAFT_1855557 [Gymnopilus junonius]
MAKSKKQRRASPDSAYDEPMQDLDADNTTSDIPPPNNGHVCSTSPPRDLVRHHSMCQAAIRANIQVQQVLLPASDSELPVSQPPQAIACCLPLRLILPSGMSMYIGSVIPIASSGKTITAMTPPNPVLLDLSKQSSSVGFPMVRRISRISSLFPTATSFPSPFDEEATFANDEDDSDFGPPYTQIPAPSPMVCKVGPPRANPREDDPDEASLSEQEYHAQRADVRRGKAKAVVAEKQQQREAQDEPQTSPRTSDDMSQKDVIALVEDGTGEGGGANNVKDGNEMDVDDEGNAFAKVKQQMSKMGHPTNALKDDGAKAGAFFQHLIEKIRAKHDCLEAQAQAVTGWFPRLAEIRDKNLYNTFLACWKLSTPAEQGKHAPNEYYRKKTENMTDLEKEEWKGKLELAYLCHAAKGDSPSPEKKSATSHVNWAAGLVRKYTMGISRIDNEVNMVTFIFDTSLEEETGKSIPPMTVVSTDACLSAIESGDLPIKAWACDTKHIVKSHLIRARLAPKRKLAIARAEDAQIDVAAAHPSKKHAAAAADDDDVVEIVDNPRPAKKLKTSRVNDENQPLPTPKATPARAVPVASSLALKPTVTALSSASKPTAMALTSASKPAVAPSASVSKPAPTPSASASKPAPASIKPSTLPKASPLAAADQKASGPSASSASASKHVRNETVVKSKDRKDTVNDGVLIEAAELQAKGAEQRADKKEGSSMDVEGSKQSVEEGEDDNLMLKKDWDAMDPCARMTAYGLKEYRKYEKRSSVPWQNLLEKMLALGFSCTNYPISKLITYPGCPGFNSASITPANMKALGSRLKHEDLIPGSDSANTDCFHFTPWTKEQKALQPGTPAYANIPLVTTDTGKVLLIAHDVLNKAPTASRKPRPRSLDRFVEGKLPMAASQSTSDPPPPYSAFQLASRLLPYRGDLGPSQHKKMVMATRSLPDGTAKGHPLAADMIFAPLNGNSHANRAAASSNQPRMPVKKPVTSSASAQALSLSHQPQHSMRYQRVAKVEPLYWDFDEAGWQDSLGWMDHGGDMDVDMDIFGPLA